METIMLFTILNAITILLVTIVMNLTVSKYKKAILELNYRLHNVEDKLRYTNSRSDPKGFFQNINPESIEKIFTKLKDSFSDKKAKKR